MERPLDQPQVGEKVKVHYTCSYDDGSVCDSTHLDGPMEFNLGKGEVLEEIEHTLLNMKPGEKAKVTLPPEKAYGHYRPELVTEIDRKEFHDRGIQPEIGLALDIKPTSGETIKARVTELNETTVRLDANHPLAGKTLQYDLHLVSKTL